ncbi:MAPEG family protein [Lysobacter sp. 2RAF19]
MTMALAYWCVLAAALLPYVWTTVAKSGGTRYDNRDPRGWVARQTDPKVHRANAAQLNAFEAFAPFAAGVVMAQLAGVPEAHVAWLAVIFVISRVLHGVVYSLGMKHSLRSLAWFVGFACVMGLIVLAALHVGGAAPVAA